MKPILKYMDKYILGYGNDKLRDCALSISHLKRHPYVLLPIIIIIIIIIIVTASRCRKYRKVQRKVYCGAFGCRYTVGV